MRGRLTLAASIVALFFSAAPAQAGSRGWAKASDIGRDALVLAALGASAVQGDWRGDVEAAVSLVAAGTTTYALKELVRERRPDSSDNRSFPSGHTSISFAAAATMENRYGWKMGLPAFGVATFVGASRVAADKHYIHDVLVGAAIGGAAGWLLSSPRDSHIQLLPWAPHRGGGLTLAAHW